MTDPIAPRILFLNPVGVIGGAERVLLNSVEGLFTAFPKSTILVILLGHGELEDQLSKRGARVHVLPLPRRLAGMGDSQFQTANRIRRFVKLGIGMFGGVPAAFLFRRRFKKLVDSLEPDILHSNGLKTHLLSAFAVSRRIPVVWHIHDYYSHRAVMAKVLRRFQHRCAGAIAISQSVADDAKAVFPALMISKISNSVDTDHYCPGRTGLCRLDELAGLQEAAPNTLRVGLVATYANWKGQDIFMDALARLESALPIRGYIVGGPIYTTAGSQFSLEFLRAKADRLGLAGRVGFIPFQPDPVGIYRSLDIVVHASTRSEPFGLTIAEAMSCGRPVIVARAGGAAELFTDGTDALGHIPGNAEDLSAKIRHLAVDPELRERIALAARQSALANFSADQFGAKLADFFSTVLAGAVPPLRRV